MGVASIQFILQVSPLLPAKMQMQLDEMRRTNVPMKDPEHTWDCNTEFHCRKEVEKSQTAFPWKVVDPYNGKPWITWEVLGLKVKNDKHKLLWKNGTDMSHAWTGLVRLQPGQVEPLHTHTTPMFYWILQGTPIVNLNYIKNRTSKWQCVTIPSECPHGIINDTNEEVVINWTYVSLTDKVSPDKNYNWKFLEDPMEE